MSIEREQDDAVPPPGTSAGQPALQPAVQQNSSHGLPVQANIDLPSPDHCEPAGKNGPSKSTGGGVRSTVGKRRTKKVDTSTVKQAVKIARDAAPEHSLPLHLLEDPVNTETIAVDSRQTRKSSSRKPTEGAAYTGATTGPRRAPRSPRQRAVEEPRASHENVDSTVRQPATATRAKSRQRKTVSSTGTEYQSDANALRPESSASMPTITNEAIAFLSNPAARPGDLFKLSADSQAFVRYHITNMERREVQGALDHAYLLATAPKYSLQFEKAADALVSKLVREHPTLVETNVAKAEPASSSMPLLGTSSPYFGSGQPTITVSLSKRIPDSSVERPLGASEENSIEPSMQAEKSRAFVESLEQASSNPENQSVAPDPIATGGSHRFLRGVTTAFQMAANWLENRERAQEKPSDGEASRATPEAMQDGQVVDRSTIVPEDVARRFLKVERDYYFLDRTPAFSDRGDKLATRGEHPEVVRSLVDIAIARGWDNITVKGTDSFRRAAWLEALQSGVKVSGYTPTALDLADLAGRPAGNTIQKNASKDRSNVPHQADNTADVEDSKRSATEQAKAGSRSAPAAEMASPELLAKARCFDKEKPLFVIKKHPELAPAYGVIDAAKKFAESSLPDKVKEEFVGLARKYVMNKIISGDGVIGPKLYTIQTKSKDINDRNWKIDERLTTQLERNRTKGTAREK